MSDTHPMMPTDLPTTNGEPAGAAQPRGNAPLTADVLDDLDRLRLSQDYATLAGTKPIITTVAVRKPTRHEFVRVRSGSEWRFDAGTFTDKENRETFLVDPALWPAMPGEISPTALLVTISRSSAVPFLWPIPLPGPEGR